MELLKQMYYNAQKEGYKHMISYAKNRLIRFHNYYIEDER